LNLPPERKPAATECYLWCVCKSAKIVKIAWRFKNFQIIMKLLPMRNSDVDLNSLRLAMNVLATLVKKSKKAQPG